jgi:hypothetical protein
MPVVPKNLVGEVFSDSGGSALVVVDDPTAHLAVLLRAYPSFDECAGIGSSSRYANDVDAFGLEDVIENLCELCVSVVNAKPYMPIAITKLPALLKHGDIQQC